jgi:hypothetical protein
MLWLAQSSIGACAMSTNIALVLLMVCSIYLAAELLSVEDAPSKFGRGLLRLLGRLHFH